MTTATPKSKGKRAPRAKTGMRSRAFLISNHRAAWDLVGGLSAPSKMPCYGYSTPADACATGSRLRAVKGSTCSGCYAMKGNYRFPKIQAALGRRLESIAHPGWVPAMVELIDAAGAPFFRWHDSGDVQSVDHLASIVAVAESTPGVSHWLPTRETAIVRDFLRAGGEIPSNLVVRISAHMVDGFPRSAPLGLPYSTVHSTEDVLPAGAAVCGAAKRDGTCGDCRACWSPHVQHVSYHRH